MVFSFCIFFCLFGVNGPGAQEKDRCDWHGKSSLSDVRLLVGLELKITPKKRWTSEIPTGPLETDSLHKCEQPSGIQLWSFLQSHLASGVVIPALALWGRHFPLNYTAKIAFWMEIQCASLQLEGSTLCFDEGHSDGSERRSCDTSPALFACKLG